MPPRSGKQFSLLKDQDGCLHIRWDSHSTSGDRPGVLGSSTNQLSLNGLEELVEILEEVRQLPNPPLLIFGSGNRFGFGTGFSPKELIRVRETGRFQDLLAKLKQCCLSLEKLPCPVIGAISGPCTGAAWELATWCDYRVVFDSPKTKLGFLASLQDWVPLPETIARLAKMAGMERAFRSAGGSQILTPGEALKWGLIDAAPNSEAALKKAMVQFRGIALGFGKKIPLHPGNTVRRLLQSTVWTRRVIQKGLSHWMDRKLPAGYPWVKGLKSLLSQLVEKDKITDFYHLEKIWLETANSQQVLDSWRMQLAVTEFTKGQPHPSRITRLGIHTLDQVTIVLALRAKATGATILALRPPTGPFPGPSKQLEELNKKLPDSILMTDSESELENCDLSLLPSLSRLEPEASIHPKSPEILARARESTPPNEPVRLFLPLPLKIFPWAALVGPSGTTRSVAEKITSLGLCCTQSESPLESWHLAYPVIYLATLECIALGLDPACLDMAAIQSGWAHGPCQIMQELKGSTLSQWISIAPIQSNDEAPTRVMESFNQWLSGPDGEKKEPIRWVQLNRVGQARSTGLNKAWQKAAGLDSDPLLEAMSSHSRHLEGVSRIEKRLCLFLASMDGAGKQETVLVVLREQLGFPGWKIRKLLIEVTGEFKQLVHELGLDHA